MNFDQIHYLNAIGIQSWQLKQKNALMTTEATFDQNWQCLENTVKNCASCPLHQSRTQTVFGTGNLQARLMIIGEAPGFHEDAQGKPFVGKAGQLLTAMLQSIGFDRSDVYIANILKCRPPNNRDPLPEEVKQCTPYLQQQINLIKPTLLLALGRIAAHYLLNTDTALGKLRGNLHQCDILNTPLIVTYHPAYLLRNPADKRKAYADMRLIAEVIDSQPQSI